MLAGSDIWEQPRLRGKFSARHTNDLKIRISAALLDIIKWISLGEEQEIKFEAIIKLLAYCPTAVLSRTVCGHLIDACVKLDSSSPSDNIRLLLRHWLTRILIEREISGSMVRRPAFLNTLSPTTVAL